MIYDVIVIGAGPAGCIAAYELAKAHLKVVLLEKEKLPRYKACGGGLPKSALELLPFDISSVIENEITKVRYSYNLKSETESRVDKPIVFMVMRDKFDYFLAEQAVKAGCELIDKTNITDISETYDRVTVSDGKHKWEGKYLIGADGALSKVSKFKNQTRNLGIGLEVELPSENLELFRRAEFGFGLIKKGYAWSFPKKNHLSLGIGTFHSKEKLIREKLFMWLEYLGYSYIKEKISAHPLPFFEKEMELVYGRTILTGDAASLMDPLSGEGMRFALKSGRLASQAIIKNNLKLYQAWVKDEIYRDLQISCKLAKFFYAFPKFSYDKAIRNPRVTKLFSKLMAGELSYKDIWEKAKNKIKL